MISIRAVIAKQQTKKQTRKGKEKKRQKREQGNKMSSKRQTERANLGKGWNAKVDRNRQTKEKAKLKQNRPAMTDCLEIADSEQANA